MRNITYWNLRNFLRWCSFEEMNLQYLISLARRPLYNSHHWVSYENSWFMVWESTYAWITEKPIGLGQIHDLIVDWLDNIFLRLVDCTIKQTNIQLRFCVVFFLANRRIITGTIKASTCELDTDPIGHFAGQNVTSCVKGVSKTNLYQAASA